MLDAPWSGMSHERSDFVKLKHAKNTSDVTSLGRLSKNRIRFTLSHDVLMKHSKREISEP